MANVLIVDDNESDRVMIRAMIAREHECFFAANGEEALKLYLRNEIDVVVADLRMPRGDGIELTDALMGLDPDASIIAVSGQTEQMLQMAQIAGARFALQKPLSRAELLETIEKACVPLKPDDEKELGEP